MYMVIANIFQTVQSFILSREPLPENLQKLVDSQAKSVGKGSSDNRKTLRSEEHTSELQSHSDLVCRLLLEKKKEEKHAVSVDEVSY